MSRSSRAEQRAASPRLPATFQDWLGAANAATHRTLGRDLHYTYDGQSALYQAFSALRTARGGRVLVPAYHCPTVIEPILRAGFAIDYYDVLPDLHRPARTFSELLTDAHAVLVVINYFGFEFDLSSLPERDTDNGLILVEDCCHSFLQGNGTDLSGTRGDIAIYSFKKLVPCYTGGAIRYNRADVPRTPAARRVSLPHQYAHARQVLVDSRDNCAWSLARAPEPAPPREPLSGPITQPPLAEAYPFPEDCVDSTMPPLARRILARSDLRACASIRRAHYRTIAACLAEVEALVQPLPDIDAQTCPWGYPLLLADRAATDYQLKNLGVPFFTFGEQLHPTLRAVVADFPHAADLSRRLLFLATHQGLSTAQVEHFCAAIVGFFAGTKRG